MIDRAFAYGVSAFGAAGVYVALALWKRRRFPENELGRVVGCFLAGPALLAAFYIASEGLNPSLALRAISNFSELRVYLDLGGLAVGWVSIATLAKEWRVAMFGTVEAGPGSISM
jgi:hypothetical protein